MAKKIRWGVIGTGKIAAAFAADLQLLDDIELVAVGSRTQRGADAFGARFDIPRRHASYAALAHDTKVDVVYIATPHPLHCENTLTCLNGGKHVLCEKAFAMNAHQAGSMISTARAKKLFLMEAMWTRFIPLVVKLRAMLAQNVIGDVRMLQADFCFNAPFNPAGRLFNPALGGGALLDIGVYPLNLASMIFGAPERLTGMAHLGKSGIDEQNAILIGYSGGRMAALYSSNRIDSPVEAVIMGSKGSIRLHRLMHHPERLTLSVDGSPDKIIHMPVDGYGYGYETEEVMNCIRAGKIESCAMPLDETLAIIKTMDALREQWGLVYSADLAR
ncbi:MAG: Gfo/Idh/MocA family oxidoreductase [Burkholderiales bacterium]